MISRWNRIKCDNCGLTEQFLHISFEQTFEEAKRYGWISRKGKDYCSKKCYENRKFELMEVEELSTVSEVSSQN